GACSLPSRELMRLCFDQAAGQPRTNAYRSNHTARAPKNHRPLWEDRFAYAGVVGWAGRTARDSRFGASAFRGCPTYPAGEPVRADESVSLATNRQSSPDFAWKIERACDRVCAG